VRYIINNKINRKINLWDQVTKQEKMRGRGKSILENEINNKKDK
jgi:hypothetical protein